MWICWLENIFQGFSSIQVEQKPNSCWRKTIWYFDKKKYINSQNSQMRLSLSYFHLKNYNIVFIYFRNINFHPSFIRVGIFCIFTWFTAKFWFVWLLRFISDVYSDTLKSCFHFKSFKDYFIFIFLGVCTYGIQTGGKKLLNHYI